MSKNGKFLHEVYTSAELELVNSSEKCKSTLTWINSKNCFEKSVIDYVFCSPSFNRYVASLCIDNFKFKPHADFLRKGDRPSDHCAMICEMMMGLTFPREDIFLQKKKKALCNFQDKEDWEKFRSLTKR